MREAPASSCVSGRIDHLIQIKDSPSARGRDELVAQCKIETYGRCRALVSAGIAPSQHLTTFCLHPSAAPSRLPAHPASVSWRIREDHRVGRAIEMKLVLNYLQVVPGGCRPGLLVPVRPSVTPTSEALVPRSSKTSKYQIHVLRL